MRRFALFGSGKNNAAASTPTNNQQDATTDNNHEQPGQPGTIFRGFGGETTMRSTSAGTTSSAAITPPRTPSSSWTGRFEAARDQAKMERAVIAASQKFGQGVQNIVVSAKNKTSSDWKVQLLELLGNSQDGPPSEIDILIENSAAEKFVVRCVENDLPPNLIHCLRLLRVLELQHAAAALAKKEQERQQQQSEEDPSSPDTSIEPMSALAAAKVSRLLTLLCVDSTVGEQLRSHLFGLFALSGASYPPSEVHVAAAASNVIIAFANACLTRNLIWYIHDRKMLIHMTDDIKELSGMMTNQNPSSTTTAPSSPQSNQSSSSAPAATAPKGLSGEAAERAGLWVIALRTVVHLVHASLQFETAELFKDFEVAGGYDVVRYAIQHATGKNGAALLELLPLLASGPEPPLLDAAVNESMEVNGDWIKFATNPRIFDIMGDLLTRSNPLLRFKRQKLVENASSSSLPSSSLLEHGDAKFQTILNDLANPGDLKTLANLSIQTSLKTRIRKGQQANIEQDASSSDLPAFNVTSELLSVTLQLFADHPGNFVTVEGKLHILTFSLMAFPCFEELDTKTSIVKMLEFVLTSVGIGEEVTPVKACVEIFFALCQTLLKGYVLKDDDEDDNESGVGALSEEERSKFLGVVASDADLLGSTLAKILQFDQRVAPLLVESGILTTNLDSLLTLLSDCIGEKSPGVLPPEKTPQDETFAIVCRVLKLLVGQRPGPSAQNAEATNLQTLLKIGVKNMGSKATVEAAGVFESYMESFSSTDGLDEYMSFVLQLLDELTSLLKDNLCKDIASNLLQKSTVLVSMLRSLLEAKSFTRTSFRVCGGFDAVIRVVLRLRDVSFSSAASEAVLTLQTIMGLLDAAIGMKSRVPLAANEAWPLAVQSDVIVDSISSQLSCHSASSLNRNFLRKNCYYLNLAAAIAGTGLLAGDHRESVLDLVFGHVDAELRSQVDAANITSIRNPDATRLVLAVAVFMPDSQSGNPDARLLLDKILRLCESDKISYTLPQLSYCGLCYSLSNPNEFGPVLFDSDHDLRSRFSTLLCRVAAFRMSYMDFIGILRNIAGPVLCSGADRSVRLPVISSSVKKRSIFQLKSNANWSSDLENRDLEFSRRLETICHVAKSAIRIPRIRLGGDSVNTIAVLMHKVKLEERLRATAEEGRLKYIEIETIDSSSSSADAKAFSEDGSPSPSSAATNEPWAPLVGNGFTFSLWLRRDDSTNGNLHILDICKLSSLSAFSTSQGSSFLSLWYDLQNQRFNVMSSASYRGEPTSFPVCPLSPGLWHHVLVTYTPAKRSVIARKSVFTIYVDGRRLEAEVKVDSVSLPPDARVIIGAPNPALAVSGVVRGILPVWELGPTLMLSTVLLDLDATSIYAYGPGFTGLLWGDRPQRMSLAATSTAVFSMLAMSGEAGSIASALRRRDIASLEAAGYSTMAHKEKDDLSVMKLNCIVPPEYVVFGFHASTISSKMRNEASRGERRLCSERLVNLARLNYGSDTISSDAIIYGRGTVLSPLSFQDCLRWVGGPPVLLPLVNASSSSLTLALALQMIRLGSQHHRPNLEMLQAGGGYRIISVLLQGKGVVDERCLDQCLAFAIHGFEPDALTQISDEMDLDNATSLPPSEWVFADLDAMKHLLLNHQVWDLKKYGPRVPLRLLTILNRLVDHKAIHKAFNARRLHQVGIVRWALHLAIEAADLYKQGLEEKEHENNHWYCECPKVSEISVGGDPGNDFLLECKNLLRRVLTFMLTPGDLEALVESIVFTVAPASSGEKRTEIRPDSLMLPGPTLRLHLVRLLEELIVDGVNEIVAVGKTEGGALREEVVLPHAGGVASPNQPYFSTAGTRGRMEDGNMHPKHQQAQNFLSAFASFLTPVWFATVLEGCQEEASASALLRLMILLLQGSSAFETVFRNSGAFSPFVLSIPKYSTCPGIALSMLAHLLNVPILHLHFLPNLDPEQLCEVFDAEGDDSEFSVTQISSEPSSGIFALVVECLGRNVQHVHNNSLFADKAAATNQAIIKLLAHRHAVSPHFRVYCCTPSFLEPLSQALCLVYDEKRHHKRGISRSKRSSFLSDVPKDLTPTERFVGSFDDPDSAGMGIVRLIRLVMSYAISSTPRANQTIDAIFRSFPIHASPQQVEAFHLVLLEHCCSVIDGVLQGGQGEAIMIANCIGLCSVFLDFMVAGLFTSEAILKSLKTSLSILNALLRFDTPVIYSLSNSDHSMLTRDAAYIANLTCAIALTLSLPYNLEDLGDEDLQSALLELMNTNIESLLLLPSRDRKSNWKVPSGKPVKPSPNAKNFDVWESASISRCKTNRAAYFPDSFELGTPDIVYIAPLLVSLHSLLLGSNDDVRGLAISFFVALLQHRSQILSELLVAEVKRGNRIDTIDVVNRGGFKALLASHEAATISESKNSATLSVKRKYASFFDWFEKNRDDVQLVFAEVNSIAVKNFPGLEHALIPQPMAVENEQKLMLVRLSSRSADRTLLGGLERAELARLCFVNTSDIHNQWKRQGFDDLAYGAMKWKILLRQLKGSSSIWEGGARTEERISLSLEQRLILLDEGRQGLHLNDLPDLVRRWKLDLTEGYERQRRRLLPNYEFHGLYNLDEEQDLLVSDTPETVTGDASSEDIAAAEFLVGSGQMEATAALLKDLNIKRTHRADQDEDYDDTEVDSMTADSMTVASTVSASSAYNQGSLAALDENEVVKPSTMHDRPTNLAGDALSDETKEDKDSSSYELITGLLQAGDWPEKSYNVNRCTGLEVTKALLLWCGNSIYVIDGFEQTGGADMEGRITRVERERSSFHINLRPKDFKVQTEEKTQEEIIAASEKGDAGTQSIRKEDFSTREILQEDSSHEVLYEHRSQRILLTDLYSVYRRRYQLQQNALEFYDVHRNSVLIAFSSQEDREEVLTKVLQSNIPNSIFSSSYGTFINYTKFMRNLKAKITSQWQAGKMTNFEFLMQLNSLAGRSFNDLTQYPVFPWVIADYDSEELDLNDPKSFRDLSKPMGAIGPERAQQFRDRYESLASTYFGEDDPPPFHYGTHYSCAAYVLYYLMRLEPFSRLALALQGGRFDVADRLFHDIGRSWASASSENLQDVRELIPEFFYLPDFLENTNHFDFGETQRGKTVHDVTLPKWAKGDPKRFIRIHRQALESDYVSKNLHHWIDLVFGFKQRGKEAVDALNTFVHVTYEGEVDIDAMEDPIQRQSTIAQIQNFGQTPSRLEKTPFPQRQISGVLKDDKSIDFGVLPSLTALTPPLCVVGAPHRVDVRHLQTETCKLGMIGQSDPAVGDICLVKGQVLGVGAMCTLIVPSKKYIRFGGINNGLSVHAAAVTARYREVNKLISIHDDMHRSPIVVAKASRNGNWLVTGSVDSTLRVWKYDDNAMKLEATLCGHDGAQIKTIDISTECGMIASGCGDGRALLWDLRTLTFVRPLRHKLWNGKPAISVSINHRNGNVVCLVGFHLCIFDINGNLLAEYDPFISNPATCAISTDCPEWMEGGIAAVTGHRNGEIRLWSIDYGSQRLVIRQVIDEAHSCPIAVLRIDGVERQDTLMIGDCMGKISIFKTAQLDSYSSEELSNVVDELKAQRRKPREGV